MRKYRIYLETSLINYLYAPDTPEKMRDTWRLWHEIKEEKYDVIISDVVIAEINRCPNDDKKSKMFAELKQIAYTLITAKDNLDAKKLAGDYIANGGLPPRCQVDALHIAVASLADCDIILSWNFKHIVKLRAMRAVEAVNSRELLKNIKILSPTIFLGED
ncbi:MAG: PIN domain-containing protein [Planctomycetota bacterium]|jgi:predicted nucleic acid-binding protein|nr:PIN domain-containing protein [Planctomycetota bacterium]